MADLLATPSDLAALLQSDLDLSTATLLLECATGVIQAATGQRIVDATDTAVLDIDAWANDMYLELPQLPVRSVATVVLDGATITDWSLRNQKLWRINGWMTSWSTPGQAKVTYAHGHPAGAQALQLGRSAALGLARGVYASPDGATSKKIDDYAVTYAAMQARLEAAGPLRAALQNAYGTSAYVTLNR